MNVPRSVADVLSDHVVFEVECIDRMYCNVYVPGLQYAAGLVGYGIARSVKGCRPDALSCGRGKVGARRVGPRRNTVASRSSRSGCGHSSDAG